MSKLQNEADLRAAPEQCCTHYSSLRACDTQNTVNLWLVYEAKMHKRSTTC